MTVLAVDALTKSFGGRRVVDQLGFSVAPGEIFGFLGGNGAGKTTSLRMILDIIRPDAGRISVLGATAGRASSREIGFLPEERGVYRAMTPLDTVVYFGRLKGLSRSDATTRGRALLDRFGIASGGRATMASLSKGMSQKVQIASALVNRPRLLLFDEPFSGLDPVNQTLLEDEILAAARQNGAGVLFSTHVMQHAERLCDRLLILSDGRKLFEGSQAQAVGRMARDVMLVCAADPSRLPGVRMARIAASQPPDLPSGWQQWQTSLEPGAAAADLLEHCTAHGFPLRGFDIPTPKLHDAFIAILEQAHHVLPAART